MNVSIIFPGQGSQYPGMSKELTENFNYTKTIYEEASDSIKVNLFGLSQNGPEDTLQLTENAQPSILVTAYAWYQVLKRELDFKPFAAGGHSLGEYTALLASSALSLPEAVRLVRTRGQLMQSAVPIGKGKMAAVIGLADDKVRALCERASKGKESLVVPANYNAPEQVVIAGHAQAVDRASEISASKQFPDLSAKRLIPLKVSAPFHSPLMQPVAEKFLAYLKQIQWQKLQFPVVFNVDAQLRTAASPIELLKSQIDHPVLWTDCMRTLSQSGSSHFVEPGPGKVLSGLCKRILPSAACFSTDGMEAFRAFEKFWKETP